MSRRPLSEDSVGIRLAAGGSITLTFRGGVFDLTPDERRLMNDLSTTLQRYQDAADLAAKGTPADGPFPFQHLTEKVGT